MKFRDFLNNKLDKAKGKNKSFSLRSLANKLEISPSTLSEFLSGEHDISRHMAEKILLKLKVDNNETKELLKDFSESRDLEKATKQISLDDFSVVSEWYHFAILSYLTIPKVNQNIKVMAEVFCLKEEIIKEALDRLVRLAMLCVDDENRYITTGKRFSTSIDIPSECIKSNHRQILNLASESLVRDSVDVRDFSNITFAFDIKKMKKAKEIISNFRNKITKLASIGKKTNVYNLSICLFPLSQKISSNSFDDNAEDHDLKKNQMCENKIKRKVKQI